MEKQDKERGRLLYESEKKYYSLYFGLSVLLLVIVIIFLLYSLMTFYSRENSTIEYKEKLGIGILGSLFALILGVIIFISTLTVRDLKVYEKGIMLPIRTFRSTFRGREDFVSFDVIKEIIWDAEYPYITIKRVNGKEHIIFLYQIRDMYLFEKFVQGKVKIVKKNTKPYTISM